MRIEQYNEDYQIREFQVRSQNAQTVLAWKFKKASHFLIFMYDCRYEFNLERAVELLGREEISDHKIVNSKSKDQIYAKETGKFKLFCVREREFLQGNKTFIIPSQELRKGIPYELSVYPCFYDSEAQELSIFLQRNKHENVQYIPVAIHPDIRYEQKLFSKQVTCILTLPHLEDYKEGAIMYHVEGIRTDFPLPAECLGKELYINVPGKDTLTVRIRDEYKNYYRKA